MSIAVSDKKRFLLRLFSMAQKKNAAAVELGRKGGKKKVPKGFAMMSDEDRKKIQSAGGKARWKGKKEAVKKA
jgi:hypothetical protein